MEKMSVVRNIENKERIVVIVDKRVEIPIDQEIAATTSARLVLEKLLSLDQLKEGLKIVFAGRITDGESMCEHYGEAFPDGKTIVFAMNADEMRKWQEILGSVGSMLLLSAHEATHIAQTRRGDPPPSSKELIKKEGIDAYRNNRHEVEAWNEAFDLFKAVRPHAEGTLLINSKEYSFPEKSSYVIDPLSLPDFIKR